MIPLKQRNLHRPDEGVFGDCHRAAVASILELPLDDVPHFMDGNPDSAEFNRRESAFLKSRGLVRVMVAFQATMDDVLRTMCVWNPGTHYILGGRSRNDTDHSVVACDGKIVHDPALDNSGVVGPMSDGYYWVTYFGAAVAAEPIKVAA